MQVHENEEDQDVNLSKEANFVLSFIHTRYTKENKRQENSKFSNRYCHIQDIKDGQPKHVNLSWDCRKSPRHPVSAEKFKMRGRNTIILHYHYRVDPKLGKGFYEIRRIPCVCAACVAKLVKDWFPTMDPSSQPRHAALKIVTIK